MSNKYGSITYFVILSIDFDAQNMWYMNKRESA